MGAGRRLLTAFWPSPPCVQVRLLALSLIHDFAGRSKLFRQLLAERMNTVLLLCVGYK